MFAITGVTGQVGGVAARLLLAGGRDVRAVIRNPDKGQEWRSQGCEVMVADMRDSDALTLAFHDTDGVFVMLPPNFDPSPDFAESRATISSIRDALVAAKPRKVVCLSTVGAHVLQPSLLTQLRFLEEALVQLPLPIAYVRAAWFMENAAWDVTPARETGEIPSFLQPLDRAIPMVATADIGRVIAETLQEEWTGCRIIELQGRERVSPDEIAATVARLLGRSVSAKSVPRETWEELFLAHGMNNPTPRIQMLDGFNEGLLKFQGYGVESRIGSVPLEVVLRELIRRGA